MTEVEPVLDFASSGRSGRRNALPDILGSPAGVNPGDLPLKLAELNLKGDGRRSPGWRPSQRSAQKLFFSPCLCTDGPGGAQSPSAEDPPAPPESLEEEAAS